MVIHTLLFEQSYIVNILLTKKILLRGEYFQGILGAKISRYDAY